MVYLRFLKQEGLAIFIARLASEFWLKNGFGPELGFSACTIVVTIAVCFVAQKC
jgi:hypothetical protein